MNIKICTKCKEELPIKNFGVLKNSKDGLRNHCKECRNRENNLHSSQNVDRVAEWRKQNPKRLKEQRDKWNASEGKKVAHNKWAEKNPDQNKNYYEANKEKEEYKEKRRNYTKSTKEQRRKYLLKYNYNMTIEEFGSLVEQQGGVCPICEREVEQFTTLVVDHDHKTGEIRGLLCSKCNLGIGHFNDDVKMLSSAIRYLNEYKD